MFCTKEDMIRHLSHAGIIAFSDHDDTGTEDDDVIDDSIERATEEITGWLCPLYTVVNLALSPIVKRWATVTACYHLVKTRGNPVPESLHEDYDKIFAMPDGWLAQTRKQQFKLPGIARSDVNTPAFSNLTIDRRFRREKIRVIPSISSPIESDIEQDKTFDHTTEGQY